MRTGRRGLRRLTMQSLDGDQQCLLLQCMHSSIYAKSHSALIETQLAHVDKNAIRGTYNHAHYLEGRREMMQWYEDHIDGLASAENVFAGSFNKNA